MLSEENKGCVLGLRGVFYFLGSVAAVYSISLAGACRCSVPCIGSLCRVPRDLAEGACMHSASSADVRLRNAAPH